MKKQRRLILHLPNTITLMNLALGCLAATEAWNGSVNRAALYILICAVLDFLDGFAARMLGAYSELGKQLDSLADLISFGVAPAAIASSLLSSALTAFGWSGRPFAAVLSTILPLFIPVFSAIRLGRFNITVRKSSHFSGMPVPADAIAFSALAFIAADKMTRIDSVILHPLFISALIILNSVLMVAPIAMFSFKLNSYNPAKNRLRYLFAASSIVLIAIFRGYGLLAVFFLYVLASVVMNFVIGLSEEAGEKSPSPAKAD